MGSSLLTIDERPTAHGKWHTAKVNEEGNGWRPNKFFSGKIYETLQSSSKQRKAQSKKLKAESSKEKKDARLKAKGGINFSVEKFMKRCRAAQNSEKLKAENNLRCTG